MAYDAPAKRQRSNLTDEDFLAIVQSERRQSVGFEEPNGELVAERTQALNYLKGLMPDLPHLANRSGAVSMDVMEAIETLLPDLIEIFIGGDDVATFKPISEQDEQQAQQETDYVNHVVFQENPGFLILYSFFKDALQLKTGVLKFWWQDDEIEPENFTGKSLVEMVIASQDGIITDHTQDPEPGPDGQPTFSFTLTKEESGGSVCIKPVPPEDFTVARDTVELADTTYCAFRTRPRAQDLIRDGLDKDVVDALPPWGTTADEQLTLARDQAGEHLDQNQIYGTHRLRTVEVVEHFVRVDADGDGKPELWRILTGGTETICIERERVDRLPFASITPYIITHRFYGESVADRLLEIQRIKTALTRMVLDAGYFALNARNEVAMDQSNEWTISDLLRNEPGVPVRSKNGEAVRPITAGQLTFDGFQALEYFSVQGEQRSGIVRNAQGLDPDTLHDTASGAQMLMAAAQKRVKLIARTFAETGVKDLILGVHALLRKHGNRTTAKLGGQWVPIDPTQWGERTQMTISVGSGSSGKAMEVAAMQTVATLQEKIVTLQGGAQGPIVDLPNIYAAVTRLTRKMGELAPEQFFSDPAQSQAPPPKPDPEAIKGQVAQAQLQQKSQQEQAELSLKSNVEEGKLKLAFLEAHDKDQRERRALQQEHEREIARIQAEDQRKAEELAIKRQDVLTRAQTDRAKIDASIQIALITSKRAEDTALIDAQAEAARASVDLFMQAKDHEHEGEMAEAAQDAAMEQAKAAPEAKGDDD